MSFSLLSTAHHEQDIVVIGINYIGRCTLNNLTIMATTALISKIL